MPLRDRVFGDLDLLQQPRHLQTGETQAAGRAGGEADALSQELTAANVRVAVELGLLDGSRAGQYALGVAVGAVLTGWQRER